MLSLLKNKRTYDMNYLFMLIMPNELIYKKITLKNNTLQVNFAKGHFNPFISFYVYIFLHIEI